jgi:ABC-2 type transport system permease protein
LKSAARRVWGLVYRHLAVYRGSWPRIVEMAYWPALQLMIWGFTASFFAHGRSGNPVFIAGALVAGVLLWEIMVRGQLGVTLTFLEEIWSRNLGHIFVSPLRPAELIAALFAVSLLRTLLGLFPATILAYVLVHYNVFAMGPGLLLFFLNLMVMGWWVALLIVALLFRYGAGAEALAWTLAFGITPIACVFYPVSALPGWLAPVALAFPAAHVFEGMRTALATGQFAWGEFFNATALNLAWSGLAILVFAAEFRATRIRGSLISIGE